MLTVNELDKKIQLNNLCGIYLFYGENSFALESSIKKIKKSFGELILGINYISVDSSNIDNLILDLSTPAFGYEKKLIIVKDSNLLKKEAKSKKSKDSELQIKISEYIEENIENIMENSLLIFCEEKIEKNSLYKTIEKYGDVCNFENLKEYELIKKLKSICKAYEVGTDESTLKYFVELVGIDMQECINEIRKLIEYAGKGGTITKDSIDLLTIKKIEAVIFDLTDSLGNKDIRTALQVLGNLQYNKEPIQKILINLYNHFKKLYIVCLAVKSNRDVEKCLNLKSNQMFLVGKYKKQASYFDERTLRIIIRELYLLDVNYKSGQIDLNVGLETILCRYCSN